MRRDTLQPGYALYRVLEGWGYAVEVFRLAKRGARGDTAGNCLLVRRYTAGNCPLDSQIYGWDGPDAASTDTLTRYAKQTARDLLREHGLKGRVEESENLTMDVEDAT